VPGLEFRVLGAVEVWRGGEPVVPGRGVMINLLATLLVSANTVVTAERLAAVAWGDRQPQHPRSALHTKVARLRRVLGTDVVETVGDRRNGPTTCGPSAGPCSPARAYRLIRPGRARRASRPSRAHPASRDRRLCWPGSGPVNCCSSWTTPSTSGPAAVAWST